MDAWNPIIAETYVERVSLWQGLVGYLIAGSFLLAGVWLVAVLVLSLVKP